MSPRPKCHFIDDCQGYFRNRNLQGGMLFREAGGLLKGSEKMRTVLLAPVLLVFGLSQTALSQSTNQPDLNLQALPAQLQKTLQDAGLTDIQIVPQSFLVRAKDRDGHLVMMVINPDSIDRKSTRLNSSHRTL